MTLRIDQMQARVTQMEAIPLSQTTRIPGPQDVPTISMAVAATFWGWGREKFQRRFKQSFHRYIRHVKTYRGLRLNLVDAISLAFPDMTEELVLRVAFDYIIETGHDGGCQRPTQKVRRRGKL